MWKRLLRRRFRISSQLYLGIGGAAALTIAASLVGWFSFNQVGSAQSRVNEDSIPRLVAAFGVAQYSGALVAAAPSLTAASPEDFGQVSADIDGAYRAFEDQLVALETGLNANAEQVASPLEEEAWTPSDERFTRISSNADTLISNIESVKGDMSELYELTDSRRALQAELAEIIGSFDDIVVPAIDDQLFYTLTGYHELGQPASPRAEHFSEAEFERYHHLSELQSDISIATQLLASAFNIPDAPSLEPLRERFEASVEHIQRNLAGLEASSSSAYINGAAAAAGSSDFADANAAAIAPIFNRIVELGTGDDSVFNLIERELRLVEDQQALLARNRAITIALVADIDALVNEARADAREVTQASTQAILRGRTLLLAISALSIGGAVLIAWLFVGRVLLRRLQMLSDWMRRMAGGDLEAQVQIGGRDEVADMAAALEVFRLHALEVQRLNLVEKLAEDLQSKNDQLESVLADLQLAQDQIVAREKLAALGQLTAGVAHEIRNPLNFVKNFSEASEELLSELKEVVEEIGDDIEEDQLSYIGEISQDLSDNMERIRSHGNRADRIVHDMLMMGRDSGEWQVTNINNLVDEHARLAFHSARATDADFQLDLKYDLDPDVGEIEVIPQDLGRVVLNMVSNACYATDHKRREVESSATDDARYWPQLLLITQRKDDNIEIHINDNGSGIPDEVVDKIFNPFFTTKPTNEGTGLGLAMCSDIIRRHGGSINVNTEPGEFTDMIISLPLTPPADVLEEREEAEAAEADFC